MLQFDYRYEGLIQVLACSSAEKLIVHEATPGRQVMDGQRLLE